MLVVLVLMARAAGVGVAELAEGCSEFSTAISEVFS